MPIGSAILSVFTESPVRAAKFSMKKSAYLKNPKTKRDAATEIITKSFDKKLPLNFSIKRPSI